MPPRLFFSFVAPAAKKARCMQPAPAADLPPKRGVPWGLVFSLGFIGGVAGWFWRSSKSHTRHTACVARLRARQVLAPDEVVRLRTANALSVSVFEQLVHRARALPNDISAREFYTGFVPDQLGGEYQARHALQQGHLLDRLALMLDRQTDRSKDELVVGLALAVRADPPQKLLLALYDALWPRVDVPMPRERFEEILRMLVRTDQIPARVLTKEINKYPLREYVEATPAELAVRAGVVDVVTRDKFAELLCGKELCVWGTCTARVT